MVHLHYHVTGIYRRCADPKILSPRQSADFNQGYASATEQIMDPLSVQVTAE